MPESAITEQPRIQVERLALPSGMAGFSQWAKGRWLIVLNASEPAVRQRFSMAHEYKHVLDSPFIGVLYPAQSGQSADERAEQICDHFAACLLMPRAWVKRAWVEGVQDTKRLAYRFDVSPQAMETRLRLMGLTERQRGRHWAAVA